MPQVLLRPTWPEDKERGIGSAAVRQFDERVLALPGVSCVWLIVREWNTRAQRVYANLGFERFDPSLEERPRFDAIGEGPRDGSFRMRLSR